MDDETLRIGRRQVANLDAQLAQANADFWAAKNNGDDDSAGQALQTYAELEQAKSALFSAYERQVQAEQAAQPRQPTREEINAKPLTAMTHQEIYDFLNRSTKHGLDPDSYKAGLNYVQWDRANRYPGR